MKKIIITVGIVIIAAAGIFIFLQTPHPTVSPAPTPISSGTPPSASSTTPPSPLPIPSTKGVVQGQVLLGPTCPVEHIPPDPNCAPRPYQTAIRVQPVNPSAPYMTVLTNTSGTFSVSLDAGTYTLQPQSQNNTAYPRCTAAQVKIVPGQTQNITLDCDTGIR